MMSPPIHCILISSWRVYVATQVATLMTINYLLLMSREEIDAAAERHLSHLLLSRQQTDGQPNVT